MFKNIRLFILCIAASALFACSPPSKINEPIELSTTQIKQFSAEMVAGDVLKIEDDKTSTLAQRIIIVILIRNGKIEKAWFCNGDGPCKLIPKTG